MSSFEELQVWQKAMDMAEAVYRVALTFPTQYRFSLCQQLERSSISVASNIAEGYGRRTTGEYIQFLGIARGSANEVITQLILAQRMKMTDTDLQPVIKQCIEIRQMLSAMMKSLGNK
ncbi:four helix bundle protein [Argonema antarcticum]|uniref:four helix bundle protein n=1 Tax=Argonema antarcticum TaxID=2942763 RepID=UPI002012D803|nr:four helix bundle protein [Argonema antarcticum]MCL1470297.1 four helix bundle protein [Argonema antarcticum A004/B2]